MIVEERLTPGWGLTIRGKRPNLSDINGELIASRLREHRVVVLRGFEITVEEFESFSRDISPDFLVHHDVGRLYVSADGTTQTVVPGGDSLPAHVERGYAPPIPTVISFICMHPASADGETTLYDGWEVFESLSHEAKSFFATNKMRYRMHIGRKLWERTLMTDDHAEALYILEQQLTDAVDAAAGEKVSCAVEGEDLIMDFVAPATRASRHHDGLIFSNSGLSYLYAHDLPAEGVLSAGKMALYTEDGSDFPMDMLREALRASRAVEFKVKWQSGDAVFIDNHHVLHGRAPFTDPLRRVYVRIGFGSF